MRGTLHLLPSAELPLWYGALGTSRRYFDSEAWQKYFGITLEELDRLTEAIGVALDGRSMTREELAREVWDGVRGSAAFVSKIAESSWGTILKPAAFKAGMCFAPSVGQRVQFTRPDTWLGASRVRRWSRRQRRGRSRAGFLRRMVRRRTTIWRAGGAEAGFRRRGNGSRRWATKCADRTGRRAGWMLAADARKVRELPPLRSVRLLPGFDQYVVAASHHAQRLLPGDLRAARVSAARMDLAGAVGERTHAGHVAA